MLRGIDISAHQGTIELSNIDCDFVIIKATQGTWYTNPYFDEQLKKAKDAGKLIGFYHYSEGKDFIGEVQHFIDIVGNVGNALIALDWESYQNEGFYKGADFVKQWCDYCFQRLQKKPIIYIQQSIMDEYKNLGYELWIAQYPNYKDTGWNANPWNEKAYKCLIRQYTSCGRVSGYNCHLDLNKFYGTKEEWMQRSTEQRIETPKGSTIELVYKVMRGECGVGEERRKKLGTRYNEVQFTINHIQYGDITEIAIETIEGKYGNGDFRKTVFGARYNKIQNRVNELMR